MPRGCCHLPQEERELRPQQPKDNGLQRPWRIYKVHDVQATSQWPPIPSQGAPPQACVEAPPIQGRSAVLPGTPGDQWVWQTALAYQMNQGASPPPAVPNVCERQRPIGRSHASGHVTYIRHHPPPCAARRLPAIGNNECAKRWSRQPCWRHPPNASLALALSLARSHFGAAQRRPARLRPQCRHLRAHSQ
eukprot:6471230-Amphidinium_carterae.3